MIGNILSLFLCIMAAKPLIELFVRLKDPKLYREDSCRKDGHESYNIMKIRQIVFKLL